MKKFKEFEAIAKCDSKRKWEKISMEKKRFYLMERR